MLASTADLPRPPSPAYSVRSPTPSARQRSRSCSSHKSRRATRTFARRALSRQAGCLDKTRVRQQPAAVWARNRPGLRENDPRSLPTSLPMAGRNYLQIGHSAGARTRNEAPRPVDSGDNTNRRTMTRICARNALGVQRRDHGTHRFINSIRLQTRRIEKRDRVFKPTRAY